MKTQIKLSAEILKMLSANNGEILCHEYAMDDDWDDFVGSGSFPPFAIEVNQVDRYGWDGQQVLGLLKITKTGNSIEFLMVNGAGFTVELDISELTDKHLKSIVDYLRLFITGSME